MDKNFFIKTRARVGEMMPDKSVLIMFAGKEICSSEDEAYSFIVNRNFYYLTGLNEENDVVMLVKENNKTRSVIFINPYDEYVAKWFGRKMLPNEVTERSGIEAIRYITEFESALNGYIADGFEVMMDTTKCLFDEPYGEIRRLEDKLNKKGIAVSNAHNIMVKARNAKFPEEIEEIRKAIHITNLGIQKMMKEAKEGMYEYQVESFFDQQIKYNGASGFAFPTICAAGKNACVLHYRANNSIIGKNELLLCDLGAEFELYKSDITRTFPVSGKFTPKQRMVYDIVLKGQKLIFETAKPGLSPRDLNMVLRKYYCVELKKIGLITKDEELDKYYFHGVSHNIGLDTHDIASREEKLVPGSIISNEPGLYIPEWEIGIRIEDDVLITEDGCENLSVEIIKDPDEIEAFMKK